MKTIFLILFSISILGLYAQEDKPMQFYLQYDTSPQLPDGKTIFDITQGITVPESLVDENGEYVYIRQLTIIVTLDAEGKVLSYQVKENNNDAAYLKDVIKHYDAYAKIVLDAFNAEQQWIPASHNGVNIPVKYFIPIDLHFSIKPHESTCHSYYDDTLKMNIYDRVDIYPEYDGGIGKFLKYITDDLQFSKEDELITRFIISVIVNENGYPVTYSINNKKEKDYLPVEQKIRDRLNKIEYWHPAKCSGINVPAKLTIPVRINLR